MAKLTVLFGSLMTSAALAQAAPPAEPFEGFAFEEKDCAMPVYQGQSYKGVIDEFLRFQKIKNLPYEAAEAVFIGQGSRQEVDGLDRLAALKADEGFAGDLKTAYIFTRSAGKPATYFMLDNETGNVCRTKPETYFNAKNRISPGAR